MTRFISGGNIYYHGTYNDFIRFRPLSHFGSIYAAQKILQGGAPKAENIDSGFDEMLLAGNSSNGKDQISFNSKAKIIPVKLNLQNTYELQDIEATHDIYYYRGVLINHFVNNIPGNHRKIPLLYDYIAKEPFMKMSWRAVRRELRRDNLYLPETKVKGDLRTEDKDRAHLFFQRLIQYFESMGFDGFHYTNAYEDKGHISYIPFRPENIIRMDLRLPDQKYVLPKRETKKIEGFRFLNLDEICVNRFEEIYHENLLQDKLILSGNKDLLLRPSSYRQMNAEKAYYSDMLFKDILPKVEEVSYQSKYGYHGLSHSQQVALFGLDLSLASHQDPLPVLLACALHDAARTNDEYCEQHGPRCEPIIREFIARYYPKMFPAEVERIVRAVKAHTVGKRPNSMVDACLWDADRIRLSWEMGFRPKFFSTDLGRHIAGLTQTGQTRYMQRQEDFLIKNGIRTAEEIKYQKQMDVKQNLIGTKFKIK